MNIHVNIGIYCYWGAKKNIFGNVAATEVNKIKFMLAFILFLWLFF